MTTTETDQKEPSLKELFTKILEFVKMIPETDDNEIYLTASAMHNAELCCFLAMASGNKYPWRKELRPISHEINEFITACERRNERPLVEDPEHPELLEDQIALREHAAKQIENARVSALAMLVHLNSALEVAVPQPANLKVV